MKKRELNNENIIIEKENNLSLSNNIENNDREKNMNIIVQDIQNQKINLENMFQDNDEHKLIQKRKLSSTCSNENK